MQPFGHIGHFWPPFARPFRVHPIDGREKFLELRCDAIDLMLMMQWNARPTVLRLATDHGQHQREREWEREREQEQQEAAAWRGEHVPLALHVVKYGCGQFFQQQQQQQHQIELIVKEKLAKNFGMLC